MQGEFRADRTARWGRLALVLVISMVAGCSQHGSPGSGPPRQLKKSDLPVAEQKYGVAPIPDKSVTYQPDVIVVGGGAAAIREQSSRAACGRPRSGQSVLHDQPRGRSGTAG
jgi:hypothetical protein